MNGTETFLRARATALGGRGFGKIKTGTLGVGRWNACLSKSKKNGKEMGFFSCDGSGCCKNVSKPKKAGEKIPSMRYLIIYQKVLPIWPE